MVLSSSSSFLPDTGPHISTPSGRPYDWIVVTHVCRHWRDTAFAFPTLWSTVDTSQPLASLAALDRAKTSPLHVCLRDAVSYGRIKPSLEQGRLLQAIAAHTSQFVDLHVHPAYRYGPAILRFFNRPAPQLRVLTIALGTGQDQDNTLPLLFSGITPELESLTLHNFAKWPQTWTLGNRLKRLCLYDQHERARIPMGEFIAMLSRCTKLEELIVIEAGPSHIHGSSASTELISRNPPVLLNMPLLRLLHIGNWSSVSLVAEFLSHLVIPRATKIEIWADVLFRGGETLASLLPTDHSSLHPLTNLRAIHLIHRPSPPDPAPQLFSVCDGILVIHFLFIARTSGELLASVFRLLDMRALQEVTIGVDCDPDFTTDWWRDTLVHAPNLQKVNIIRRRSRSILFALTIDRETEEVPEASIPCPALTSLVITDDSALAFIRLFALAQERASYGVPIRSLIIINATPGLSYRYLEQRSREEMEDLCRKNPKAIVMGPVLFSLKIRVAT